MCAVQVFLAVASLFQGLNRNCHPRRPAIHDRTRVRYAGAHLVLESLRGKYRLAPEELDGHDAERPGVQGGGDEDLGVAGLPGCHHLRRRVVERERERRGAAGSGRAAKVDERPPVLARQPHHVGWLEVTVHVPRRMQPL